MLEMRAESGHSSVVEHLTADQEVPSSNDGCHIVFRFNDTMNPCLRTEFDIPICPQAVMCCMCGLENRSPVYVLQVLVYTLYMYVIG